MRPPASWAQARLTLAIAAVTAAAWLIVALLGRLEWAAIWGGFIPMRAALGEDGSVAPFWLTPLTATLVHAGLIHLAFNLVILTFCGRHVEWVLGPGGIAILYLVGAYAAAGGQYLADPQSAAPMIGASGAISAVLGAYAVLFGRNKVKVADRRLVHRELLGAGVELDPAGAGVEAAGSFGEGAVVGVDAAERDQPAA